MKEFHEYLIIKTIRKDRVAINFSKIQSFYNNENCNLEGFTHIVMDDGLIYKTNIKFEDFLNLVTYDEPW